MANNIFLDTFNIIPVGHRIRRAIIVLKDKKGEMQLDTYIDKETAECNWYIANERKMAEGMAFLCSGADKYKKLKIGGEPAWMDRDGFVVSVTKIEKTVFMLSMWRENGEEQKEEEDPKM